MLWDIFCKVIDNHGDIGVCWRLAAQLARRGEQVRLWVDEPSALAWMAPQGEAGVEVIAWTADAPAVAPGDVVIEAFGCALADAFVQAMAQRTRDSGQQPPWINLEYLSAEDFVARSHGLPSPVLAGPGAGLTKHFFYPGFTMETGGLLREPDLAARQAAFDRAAWLAGLGLEHRGERLVSLFCYEPPALAALLQQLAAGPQPTRLLVAGGRPQAAVQAILSNENGPQPAPAGRSSLSISYLPLLTQSDNDHLLRACDFNFVRGEDSWVRALWAGKPFVWQAYPQEDGAHHAKLQAFMDWLDAPISVRAWHAAWNSTDVAALPPIDALEEAAALLEFTRTRLGTQPDLVSQLLGFVVPPVPGRSPAERR